MRIILYRYHDNLDFCKDRLSFIKKNNPTTPIYGLFGGKEEEYPVFNKELSVFFNGNYCIKGKSGIWKWKHSDLAFRLWFQDYGKDIKFTSIVVLEWDLLQFDSIANIYSHVSENQIGLTGLTLLKNIENEWYWTRNEQQKKEWHDLLHIAKTKFKYNKEPFGALCPGVCLPRNFLEKYSKIEIPELCHDELRIPLFGQILGFELIDNGFYKKWFSKKEWKYFNCNDYDIITKQIKKELRKKNGRRVFHPYRNLLNDVYK